MSHSGIRRFGQYTASGLQLVGSELPKPMGPMKHSDYFYVSVPPDTMAINSIKNGVADKGFDIVYMARFSGKTYQVGEMFHGLVITSIFVRFEFNKIYLIVNTGSVRKYIRFQNSAYLPVSDPLTFINVAEILECSFHPVHGHNGVWRVPNLKGRKNVDSVTIDDIHIVRKGDKTEFGVILKIDIIHGVVKESSFLKAMTCFEVHVSNSRHVMYISKNGKLVRSFQMHDGIL